MKNSKTQLQTEQQFNWKKSMTLETVGEDKRKTQCHQLLNTPHGRR